MTRPPRSRIRIIYNHPGAIFRLIENGAARIFMDWREIPVHALIKNMEAGI